MATVATAPAETAPRPEAKSPVVIDMGKQRRKRVKALRRGTGRLADKVSDTIEELRAAGTVAPDSQTVIVIVRQRRRRSKGLRRLLPGL
ncbi:MAG: hypothetical protein IT179_02590 [Acidobacteria bacterium]|nr:hypothetical protein [Acidobacteriota bacterium]